MESIYYVMTWLCHRTCAHCYEERFHPYYGDDLERVVAESRTNAPRIIANLPDRMTYADRADGGVDKPGSVILAGGEILLDAVREPVLYPAIRQLRQKYSANGGVKIIIQTTGDILTPAILNELRELGVWLVSVSGIDAFHQGLESIGRQEAMKQKLTAMLEAAGYSLQPQVADKSREGAAGPYFHFFGATPDMWIGRLWPRGRAWANRLSTATIEDNFCNRWSGGLNFLNTPYEGSEVSIEPTGDVYPCCAKTKLPIGNLLEDRLEAILDRVRGNPVYEAINQGRPELMGLQHGWSAERFLEASRAGDYQNLCIGCDRFHEEVLRAKA
jgi:sulfatase maturation enzyme AslB (radical SAM superfamily)